MDGRVANEFQQLCRKIYEEFGLDYTVMNVCGARFARGLHVITFNREDADERARADACYRKMSDEVGARGVFVGACPGRLSRLSHAAGHAGIPRRLRGHQGRA